MKTLLEDNEKFDIRLEPSDWRYSAGILGLIEYFSQIDPLQEFHEFKDDCIEYDSKALTQENYLKFVEYKYGENLHHIYVESKLKRYIQNDSDEKNNDFIKSINEKLTGNTVMKNVFKKVKFDGNNKDEILDLIDKNREKLTLETFRNKQDMYRNFCNTNQLFNESQNYCRLVGYYIDAPKKGKSTGYAFNMNSFVGQDIQEFDFIPFAFINDRESLFINDNYEIKRLRVAKQILENKIVADKSDLELKNKTISAKYSLFKAIIESSDFIDYDVEVIVKDRDKDYFETLYIRQQSIDILKKINDSNIDYNSLCFSYKINDNYYINIYQKVMECILNNTLLDGIIDILLKNHKNNYIVSQLIKINSLIRGGNKMNKTIRDDIYKCSARVINTIPANKLDSYRNKLTSSIIFKDYDRFCEILLQLSNYAGIYFSFAERLFVNFEDNKDIAYTFVNSLSKNRDNDSEKSK